MPKSRPVSIAEQKIMESTTFRRSFRKMPYISEIKCLMFVNGDTEEPCEPTARLIETTVKVEILKLVSNCDHEITLADIVFQFGLGNFNITQSKKKQN